MLKDVFSDLKAQPYFEIADLNILVMHIILINVGPNQYSTPIRNVPTGHKKWVC